MSDLSAEQRAVLEFVVLISHGDEEHRRWLAEAAIAYVRKAPIPAPRGSGTKEGAAS